MRIRLMVTFTNGETVDDVYTDARRLIRTVCFCLSGMTVKSVTLTRA